MNALNEARAREERWSLRKQLWEAGIPHWETPARCHSCLRRSWNERDHVTHRCNRLSVWLVRMWRRVTGYQYGPTLLPLLLLLPLLHGCAFLQKPATQRIIRCTGSVAAGCKDNALPLVAACLAAIADPGPCMGEVLSAGVCITRESLACAARDASKPTPPLMTALMSPVADRGAEDQHKADQAKRWFDEVGLVPVEH